MKNKILLLSIYFVCLFFKEEGTAQNGQPSFNFDYRILKNLNNIQSTSLNNFQIFISDTNLPFNIGIPTVIMGIGLITKNKDMTNVGLQTGIAMGATVLETFFLKELIKRDRPYTTYPDLKNIATSKSFSFPSGHASTAFSLATSLSLNYPKWYVIAPAYSYALATSFSRLYLNVHYPTDVLAGAILGTATAWITWKINKKLVKRKDYTRNGVKPRNLNIKFNG